MSWLESRVPLTLLADLVDLVDLTEPTDPLGPTSREIYRVEAVADDVRRELDALAKAEAAATDFTTNEAAC